MTTQNTAQTATPALPETGKGHQGIAPQMVLISLNIDIELYAKLKSENFPENFIDNEAGERKQQKIVETAQAQGQNPFQIRAKRPDSGALSTKYRDINIATAWQGLTNSGYTLVQIAIEHDVYKTTRKLLIRFIPKNVAAVDEKLTQEIEDRAWELIEDCYWSATTWWNPEQQKPSLTINCSFPAKKGNKNLCVQGTPQSLAIFNQLKPRE